MVSITTTTGVTAAARRRGRSVLIALSLTTTLAGGGMLSGHAAAQDRAAPVTRSFTIPAGALADVLARFADQTGIQLLYPANIVENRRSAGVDGTLTPEQALAQLLGGTGLSYRFNDPGTATLSEPIEADGRVLGPVTVQGGVAGLAGASVVNGINGSRDVTATEGTGSLTSNALTVGSKMAVEQREVPQSISVLTAQRMEEQVVTSLNDALERTTGVTSAQGNQTGVNDFYSRGFLIDTIQIDGGSPLRMGGNGRPGIRTQLDMAQFDHVELLRGASGTFNGYGNPSGSINLTRKRPLDHPQVVLEGQLGSWDRRRIVADMTSPLAFNGRLRARGVVSYQSNEYFYDIANDDSLMLYGVLEADVTSTTLLSGGISDTRVDGVPVLGGLPRNIDGSDPGLSRRTAFGFPWNRSNTRTVEYFGAIEQKVGAQWTGKLNVTYNRQTSDLKFGAATGAIDPETRQGTTYTAGISDDLSRQLAAELTVTGTFRLFGQDQRVAMGFSRGIQRTSGVTYPALAGTGEPLDPYNFNPLDARYREPAATPAERTQRVRREFDIGYLNLSLTPFNRFHVDLGVRYTRLNSRSTSADICQSIPTLDFLPCFGSQIGDPNNVRDSVFRDRNLGWPPSLSARYDVTDTLTVYGGYTDIYDSQASRLDRNLNPIQAITGANYELGVKYQSPNKRLNASLAAYRIDRDGIAIEDAASFLVNPDGTIDRFVNVDNNGTQYPFGEVTQGTSCCFLPRADARSISQGVDAEISGEILTRWQLQIGYTYNSNRFEGADLAQVLSAQSGAPLLSRQPEHLLKLWTTYAFAPDSAASGLSVSAGVQALSSAYQVGSVCLQLLPPESDGFRACAPGRSANVNITQGAYAVVSARLEYRLSERWSASLNFDNLLDKSYFLSQGVSSFDTNNNWYGEPRSAVFAIRAKW